MGVEGVGVGWEQSVTRFTSASCYYLFAMR